MPQMSLILSKKDIRNVIAYLSTLKEDWVGSYELWVMNYENH
jgi:hypothetical protein